MHEEATLVKKSPQTFEFNIDDPVQAIEKCYELGWSDGLPVVPPTVDRVNDFLAFTNKNPDEVVGTIPERRREVTVQTIAANAVMAGCLPEYLPLIITAAEAMLDPLFNIIGPSSSLGGAGILTIINGPITQELNINSGSNLFGPGNRANATIGRCIRLILMNTCAATPGLFDRSILGHPGKYSYCIAEAEASSHWKPLHVDRGFKSEESTVTVFACEAPRQVRTSGDDPRKILYTVADVISSLGTSMCTIGSIGDASNIVRQGEVAIVISGDASIWSGWEKSDVKNGLIPLIKRSLGDLKRAGEIKGPVNTDDDKQYISLIDSASDILLVFAGGTERTLAAVMPSWGPKVSSTSVTRVIT